MPGPFAAEKSRKPSAMQPHCIEVLPASESARPLTTSLHWLYCHPDVFLHKWSHNANALQRLTGSPADLLDLRADATQPRRAQEPVSCLLHDGLRPHSGQLAPACPRASGRPRAPFCLRARSCPGAPSTPDPASRRGSRHRALSRSTQRRGELTNSLPNLSHS